MRLLATAFVLLSASVYAQTRPLGLPRFANPPELNGADPVLYENGVLYNTTLACTARSTGNAWECVASRGYTDAAIASANATQDAQNAATYMTLTAASGVINTMQSSINGNSTSIAGLSTRVSTLESQITGVQQAASQAQASATSAATSATAAQTAANAAQSASTANATAISALTTRVTAAESAIAALQALPRLACTTFNVPTGVSVPLTGISTVINVPLAGVPVGTACDTGAPSRMPLGARPDPIVTTAGTVNMAFVSNSGLLSSVIAIPSGTYRLCCVL